VFDGKIFSYKSKLNHLSLIFIIVAKGENREKIEIPDGAMIIGRLFLKNVCRLLWMLKTIV
jgi:hypothetical protein